MQYDRAPVIRTGLPTLSSALIRLVRVKNIKFCGSPSWLYLVCHFLELHSWLLCFRKVFVRRVRRIVKSYYYLPHVCLYVTPRLPLDGFSLSVTFDYVSKNLSGKLMFN
jgi:hypothetical protein